MTTPKGIADPKSAIAAMDAAATKVKSVYGALDVPWGNVFRLHYGGVDLPANGGDDPLDLFRAFRNLWFAPNKDGG